MKTTAHILRVGSAALALTVLALPACKKGDDARTATAELRDADGDKVGEATINMTEAGLEVEFEGMDLPPGTHGFHIHEVGKCDPPSFESAGGHFDPTNEGHGFADEDGHHVGDMPNLEVEQDGTADFKYVVERATLEESGDFSLLAGEGTALVIHENPDDMVTDPAGDAGPRIACGVIELR